MILPLFKPLFHVVLGARKLHVSFFKIYTRLKFHRLSGLGSTIRPVRRNRGGIYDRLLSLKRNNPLWFRSRRLVYYPLCPPFRPLVIESSRVFWGRRTVVF